MASGSLRRGVRAVALGAVTGALMGWARRRRRRLRNASSGGIQADVPDEVILARVRERAAVPGGVEVVMTEGAVVLFGRVMRSALVPLLERVANVEGVVAVENRLTPVDAPFERPPP